MYSLPSPTPTPTATATVTPTPTPTITPTKQILPFTQCRNADLTIPDGGFALDTMQVNQSGTIQSMKVKVDITHPLVNDLVVTLKQTNTGKLINLIDQPRTPTGNICYGDDVFVTLADNSSMDVDSNCFDYLIPAISGEKRPSMFLVVYNGEQMKGEWELVARDEQKQFDNHGRLNVRCLEFQYTEN